MIPAILQGWSSTIAFPNKIFEFNGIGRFVARADAGPKNAQPVGAIRACVASRGPDSAFTATAISRGLAASTATGIWLGPTTPDGHVFKLARPSGYRAMRHVSVEDGQRGTPWERNPILLANIDIRVEVAPISHDKDEVGLQDGRFVASWK